MATAREELVELDPKAIKIGWRARKDYGDVPSLARSIEEHGQLQPIVVRWSAKNKAHYLIAGGRRRKACIKLGRKILARVVTAKSELSVLTMQLQENVARKDFDQLEIGEGLQRFKKVYEAKHPEAKLGTTTKRDSREAKSFATVAAKTLAISASSVYSLLQVGALPPAEKAEIDKAPTSKRNAVAREQLRKVRRKAKEQKLEAAAKRKQAQRKKAGKKATKKKGPAPATNKPSRPSLHIYKGDCADVMDQFNAESIDVVFTDPDYGLGKLSSISHTTRKSINAEPFPWDQLDLGWVSQVAGLIVPGGHLMAFCTLEMIGEYRKEIEKAGLAYRTSVIWHKTNPPPVHRDMWNPGSCEAVVWATKLGGTPHFKPFRNAGKAEAHNLIEHAICGGKERLDHPTQKPLGLVMQLLDRVAAKKDVVLDPFAGTGTTLVACRELGLEGHGIEKSPKFCKLMQLRLKALG
jgi:DNA modification methylase